MRTTLDRYVLLMAADQAKDVEQRIERLHLEDGDGDHHVDFEKVPQGWIRMEQLLDEAGVAASPELHRSVVESLGREVRDHATTYLTTTDIRVDGVTPAELVAWLRPLLDEDQDSITVNGQEFDLNPEE